MLKTSLRYLMSVARYGSIRAASAELNIVQSAVSRRLQALEYEIGTPLLERRPRGVVLTDAGELVYAYCRKAAFDADRLQSELDELRELRRGRVRIASIESLVPHVLCNSVDQFRKQYPGVTFSIDILTTDRVFDIVREGDVDIGIIFGRPAGSDIKVVYTSDEPLLAAMSPDHPLAGLDSLSIQDLAQWPIALAHSNSGARTIFDQACRKAGIEIKPVLESNSIELMHRFALAGSGITVLLRHSAIDSTKRGQLTTVPLRGGVLAGHLSIIALKDRQLTLAAERFLRTVCECMAVPENRGVRQ